MADDDTLSPRVREILALFWDDLSEQRFGDLDADALRALAERTKERALAVIEARAILDAALGELEATRADLSRRAEQALAYARVFAETDAELKEKIDALDVVAAAPKTKRRRKVKKKREADRSEGERSAELPFEGAA
ncbi:MAG: hypothetical protein SangKO_009070 [Sandaracinaceae bacterium]